MAYVFRTPTAGLVHPGVAGISVHGQQQGQKNPYQAWSAEVVGKCDNFQFPGQGQKARLVDPDQRGAVGQTDTIGRTQAQTVISEPDQKGVHQVATPGGTQSLTVISDPDQKGLHRVETPGGLQSLTVISESGFYDVVARSDKPQGKQLPAAWPPIKRVGSGSRPPAAPSP